MESLITAPTRRRWLRAGAVSIVIAALLTVFFAAMRLQPPHRNPQQGRTAPVFSLSLFDGGRFDLAAAGGRVVLVNFWSSWCLPCRDEAPLLEATWRAYRGNGLVVVGVNLWDAEHEARAFLQRYRISFPAGSDPKGRTAIAYGVAGIPESYFVERSGRIAVRVPGSLTAENVATTLASLGFRRP